MLGCLFLSINTFAFSLKKQVSITVPEDNVQKEKQLLSLLKNKRLIEAEKLLNQTLMWPYRRESLGLLFIRAELCHLNQDYVAEAKAFDDILQLESNDKLAIRGRAFALELMGAVHLAMQYVEQYQTLFSQVELATFKRIAIGKTIAWGKLEAKEGLGQQRFATTDKVLNGNNWVTSTHSQQQEFNKILALRDRSKMQEVITLYQQIKPGSIIPANVIAAAAEAYLYLREPGQAIELYQKALVQPEQHEASVTWEWQLNLANAYTDANDFDAAQDLVDRLVKDMPPVLNRGLRGVEADNEYYEQARVSQAQTRMFADQYAESQSLLENMLTIAPFNSDAKLAYGDLLQFREQPRAAQHQYASALVDDPSSNGAVIGIAETACNLQDYRIASKQLGNLRQHYPEDLEVQRVEQLCDAYQSPLLTVTSGWSHNPSGGGRRGNQDWQVDAIQYSGVFKHNWRVFAHSFNAEAKFDDSTGIRKRVGVGADYRSPAWQLSGEVNQSQDSFDDYGVNLRVAWSPNDHWLFDVAFASNSDDIPLQASISGLEMRSIKFGVNFLENESRDLDINLNYAWLTDNNRRLEIGTNWRERWWSGSTYKLDTTLGISASDNSRANTDYFNPSKDLAIEAQVINEWTLWRNYRQDFKHRLIFGVGQYWQERFASGTITRVRYEHEWNIDPARSISYGAAYERHPYDGELNESTSVFLNLNWHF